MAIKNVDETRSTTKRTYEKRDTTTAPAGTYGATLHGWIMTIWAVEPGAVVEVDAFEMTEWGIRGMADYTVEVDAAGDMVLRPAGR